MKNVCCYIGTLGAGGIESCTISQFLNLPKDPLLRFTFLLDYHPQNQLYVDLIKSNGGNIIYLFDSEYGHKYTFYKLRKIFRLLKTIKRNNFTSVHFHTSIPSTLVYPALSYLFTKAIVFITSHAQGSCNTSNIAKGYYCICRNIIARFSNYRYAVSRKAGTWMYGNNSFIVVPNGISLDRFRYNPIIRKEIRSLLNVENDCFLLGHVGRFEYDKNHAFILDVFCNYKSINSTSKLLLIGDGSLHKTIENMCIEKGIMDDVIFVNNTDSVFKYLWAMDVLLFPSHKEGFGLVAVEAQAASLAVVASDNVPNETNQTDIITYLPIDSTNIGEWTKEICKISEKKYIRANVNMKKLYANCDIRNVSAFLYNKYK